MKRIYNFSSGPAILPVPVLEEASRGVLEIGRSGMSILEVSHRGREYEPIHQGARMRLLQLLGLSADEYTVLFLGGGATLQFAMVPMNFLSQGRVADFVHTGEWSGRAITEARRFGNAHLAASSEPQKFSCLPAEYHFTQDAAYVHLTTNNTIEGTQFRQLPPELPPAEEVPLVVDASSDLLGVVRDHSRFDFIYAGAQKNLGPAGVTVVVARKKFLEKASRDVPSILSYVNHAGADALLNTPPVFSIYVLGLTLQWLEGQGGVTVVAERNERKARVVYEALDEFPAVYDPTVKNPEHRSWMNLTFRLKSPAREADFLAGAQALGMDGLKGHRSVGGFRASMYNAFPEEGAHVLAEYLRKFAGR
ncbi:MAG: 3-phosphoserine/phosphohydroxythreonine transaminase [Oligoflexia bacterium]